MNEYTFSELKLGMKESFNRKIGADEIEMFSALTGDANPLHLDENYVSSTQFKRTVVFGQLVNSYLSTLAGMYLPGKYSLILSVESYFKNPCYQGDEITIKGEITKIIENGKLIIIKTEIINHKMEILQTGKMIVKLLK